jgi:hypothetical protein
LRKIKPFSVCTSSSWAFRQASSKRIMEKSEGKFAEEQL